MRNTINVCDGVGKSADREAKSEGTEDVFMLFACQLSTWLYFSLVRFHAKCIHAHQLIRLIKHSRTHTHAHTNTTRKHIQMGHVTGVMRITKVFVTEFQLSHTHIHLDTHKWSILNFKIRDSVSISG